MSDLLTRLKLKYTGSAASNYNKERELEIKWHNEQEAVRNFLFDIAANCNIQSVLDTPVGTGRFFPFYKQLNISVIGIDISEDMLAQSKEEAERNDLQCVLSQQDIVDINLNQRIDIIVCTRFMNWLDFNLFEKCLGQLSKLMSEHLIIGVRVFTPINNFFSYKYFIIRLSRFGKRIMNILKKSIYIHAEDKVIETFRRHSWTVADKTLVDRGKMDGSLYYIYRLKRLI